MKPIQLLEIQSAVLTWQAQNGRRSLPWRNLGILGVDEGYGVMVSEFMLQQTQVERVIPKYHDFLARFPTLASLAQASAGEVISMWSGLGYNRRAVLLHRAAQAIHENYNDIVPADPVVLVTIPGIGPYTAGAIAAFAYNKDYAVVDTNIERFFELLFYGYDKPNSQELRNFAQTFVPLGRSREWHSALMDLMTIVRKEKTPLAQQEKLLEELKLTPSWELPQLGHEALIRPKQSTFKNSTRFYRGQIIKWLTQSSQLPVQEIMKQLEAVDCPYDATALLLSLKKDELILFEEPLSLSAPVRLST